jgi:hypothetical protein
MITTSMFESIKEALAKNENSSGNPLYKEILKFKENNTYVLRLLPNFKDASKTFFHFFIHGWNSFQTGQYVSALSLQTIGQPDPIGRERMRLSKTGSQEEKQKVEAVKWQEQWYVNVYVVDDPVNPANNGTVKIFRYGKKLDQKITAAIKGDDSDEFGMRVFDLSPNGVNFKLKVEKNQGGYISYDSSRFTSPIDLNLTKEKQKEIYDSIHDLTAVNQIKSEEELMKLWKEHFLCVTETTSNSTETTKPVSKTVESEPVSKSSNDQEEISDEMVAELLKGLE